MDADQCFLIPFYEYMKTIIGVTALKLKTGNCSDKHFEFRGNFNTEFSLNFDNNLLLTESRKHKSNRFDIRLVMRICKTPNKTYSMHKKTNSMVDCFPLNLKLCINDQPVQLSSYLPYDRCRRPGRMNPRLIDITDLILDSSNCNPHTFNIHWVQDNIRKQFNFALYLVRRRSYDELSSILMKYRIFSVQNTINLFSERIIIHPVNNKSNIDYMFQDRKVLNTSLICPLSLSRMKIPVRGGNCTHLKCFDLMSYLIINFKKPTWTCPICDKKAFFCLLKIDGLIYSIINDKRSNLIDEIEFNENGQWKFYDEVPDENSDTDKFYDIPENYCSLKINNEQLINGSKTQKCSETVSGVELNKDLKNILPISDWLSLKNEFISSNGTNIVASLETSTLSNGSNSKSSPVQTLSSKKSSISNSNSTNTPINSKTRVFQENRHQTNLTPNSNNNTNNNNLKRTHLNSSSESGNEKEIPVKKLICDSSSLPKVNVSKIIEESAHNDESLNKESEHRQNQSTIQNQNKYNYLNNNKINEILTSSSFTSFKSRSLLYRNIRNFIFKKKQDPSIETFSGITNIPNNLKFNTYDKDFIVFKSKEIKPFSLKQLIGSIKLYKDPQLYHKQGERVMRKLNIHVAKATIKFFFNQETWTVLPNHSFSIKLYNKIGVDEMKLEIQDTPACIGIELIYNDSITIPFTPLKPLVGEICIDNETVEKNISFLKYKHLTIQDEDELTLFVDIRVGEDSFQKLHLLAITIINIKGQILIDEIVCPRNQITHFRKEVTGIFSDQIINKKDAYPVIIQTRNMLHGKIIIGYNIGNKLISLFMDYSHIIGLRDLSEDKWAKKYAPNAERPKLLNIIETLFKSSKITRDEKDFILKARKEGIPTTLEKVSLIRTTYCKIRSTGGWKDTITPDTKLTKVNIEDTNLTTKPISGPIIKQIN